MNCELIKQLARQYGCLQTIPLGVKQLNNDEKECEQIFDYVIVIDFESTCWNDGRKLHNQPEIIEFPCVLLNTRTGILEDKFQQYVMPTENPKLSSFCINFTGITQDQVDNGVPLGTCLVLFSRWIKKIMDGKSLTFHKKENGKKACTFVTWSDWDLSTCLNSECKRKNILKPEILNEWIDLRAVYKTFYKRQPKGLRGAMSEVGLKFEGREHSGLSDACNTARLLYRLVQDGVVLKITKTLYPKENPTLKKHIVSPKVSPQRSFKQRKLSTQMKFDTTLCDNNTPVSSRRCYGTKGTREGLFLRRINCFNDVTNTIEDDKTDNGKLRTIQVKNKNDSSDVFETPPSARLIAGSSCKRTPPLCKCGRRALRRVASVSGPNKGRSFYVCPNSKSLGTLRKSGCGFFKWEF